MAGHYKGLVDEMLARMTEDEQEEICKKLMGTLGIEEKPQVLPKHCPLCGVEGELVIDKKLDDRSWIVHCTKCGRGGMCGMREEEEDLETPATREYGEELNEAEEEFEESLAGLFEDFSGARLTQGEEEEEEEEEAPAISKDITDAIEDAISAALNAVFSKKK